MIFESEWELKLTLYYNVYYMYIDIIIVDYSLGCLLDSYGATQQHLIHITVIAEGQDFAKIF